jgi:antitoxin HigA-1
MPGQICPDADHAGLSLRRHVLPALELSVSQAARELGIARQTLHRILAGATPITPEMAVRLERLCGISSGFWLHRQQRYEAPRIREQMANDLTLPLRRAVGDRAGAQRRRRSPWLVDRRTN